MAGKTTSRDFDEILEEFVREHRLYLCGVANKLAPDSSMADDIVQDAFVIAVKKAGSFDRKRQIRTWLAGIVRNLCKQAWEKAIRENTLQKDALARYTEQLAEEPSGLFTEDAIEALDRCLGKIPERGRTLLNLRYNLHRKSDEIATDIGSTADAVRTALSRLRQQLKACVQRYLPLKEYA